MADIQLISTSSVKAASHKECPTHERIDLTPWDLQLLLLGPIQKGLLFHKPKAAQEIREYSSESSIIQHLRTSLSRTLDFFNPLAGRLVSIQNDDNSTSYFIDCNNAGAQFVHATANGVVTIADILEPVYVPDRLVHSFFPLNGVQNCEGTSKPLLGVQVTELVDGIFIGCTLNHCSCRRHVLLAFLQFLVPKSPGVSIKYPNLQLSDVGSLMVLIVLSGFLPKSSLIASFRCR
ncbi:hypothetical protein I3843_02G003600 [Carya illinoinensis]|nr:hypothetical protein I3843_02G003600 [Carya illinoinensis]